MTSSPLATLPSFNSHRSGYDRALNLHVLVTFPCSSLDNRAAASHIGAYTLIKWRLTCLSLPHGHSPGCPRTSSPSDWSSPPFWPLFSWRRSRLRLGRQARRSLVLCKR